MARAEVMNNVETVRLLTVLDSLEENNLVIGDKISRRTAIRLQNAGLVTICNYSNCSIVIITEKGSLISRSGRGEG